MFRRLSAAVALLALLASACTSSAGAGESTFVPPAPAVNAKDAAAGSLIEAYYASLGRGSEYALYAMFVPVDDRCGPDEIADLISAGPAALFRDAEFEVQAVDLAVAGDFTNPAFDLVERRGTSEKVVRIDRFLPIVDFGDRLRFNADACEWFTHFGTANGDVSIREELQRALDAVVQVVADQGDYFVSVSDLRLHASGLRVVDNAADLTPGGVVVLSAPDQVVLAGQGLSGTWYCVALADGAPARYGAGLDFDSVADWELCAAASTTGSW